MNSAKWTLVRGARQLLTLHRNNGPRRGPQLSEIGVIQDGSVLLRDGVVDAVGPTRRIGNLTGARNAEEIDAAGRVVMPAFVDPHATICPVPGTGPQPSRTVNSVPATRLEAQSDRLLRIMARHGTATIGSFSGHGGDVTGELKILRALCARNNRPLDIVSILRVAVDASNDTIADLLATVIRRRLASNLAIRTGDGALCYDGAVMLMAMAQSLGFAIHFELLPGHDVRVVEHAAAQNVLSITYPARYRIQEIEELASSSTFAILVPDVLEPSHAGIGRLLADGGALLALASGVGPESGGSASMQAVIQHACRMCGLTLEEAISAATINAAYALGVASRVGSLEHGKSGDLLLLNVSDYREIPMYSGTNLVHAMMKKGTILFEEEFRGWPKPVQ